MAARQFTSILLILACLAVTATSRQTRRQTPTETAAQSHLIAASIDPKHLLRDDDLAVIKNMITTTENNDPEVEESEASRIGYITDQQRSQSSCNSCSLGKKRSGNDHLRGKILKSSIDDSRHSSNKNDDGSTISNDMRASQGSNNAKESALHKVQDAETKVEDAQSEVEDLRSEISKESHSSSDNTVNQALENAENELAEAEEKESETKLDAQDVGATSDETDAAERGTLKTTKGEDSTVKGESNTETNSDTKEGDQQKEEDEDEEKIENGVKEDNGSKSDDAVLDNGEAASSSSVGGIKFPNLPLDKLAKAVADNVESPSPSSEEAKEDAAARPPPRAGESPNMPIPFGTLPLDALAAAAKAGAKAAGDTKKEGEDESSSDSKKDKKKHATPKAPGGDAAGGGGGGGGGGPIPIPIPGFASPAYGGLGKDCPCKKMTMGVGMNPRKISLINAEKSLKWQWKMVWCKKEKPPKNIPICKTPMKSANCCECDNEKKVECMGECLDNGGYDDMDDGGQKVHMAYCGFACQGCDFTKVPMVESDGGGTANALGHKNPEGSDDGTPPSWWMSTMASKLALVKAKTEATD